MLQFSGKPMQLIFNSGCDNSYFALPFYDNLTKRSDNDIKDIVNNCTDEN